VLDFGILLLKVEVQLLDLKNRPVRKNMRVSASTPQRHQDKNKNNPLKEKEQSIALQDIGWVEDFDYYRGIRTHIMAVKAWRKGKGKRKEEGGETALTNTKR